ncbi:MAG: MFS transporter [Francisellaceae bacterium]
MLQAIAISLVTTLLSFDQRNKALGTVIMFAGAGPVFGPAVGGLLMSTFGWQAIFLINIPICLIGIYLCRRLQDKPNEHHSEIHGGSLALIILFVTSLILTATALSDNTISHIAYQVGFILVILSAIALLVHEQKSKKSILPLSILLNLNVVSAMMGLFAMGFSTIIIFMLPPLYLMQMLHFEPYQVGFVSLLAPFSMMLLSKNTHRLIQRFGVTMSMRIGLVLMIIALGSLSAMSMAKSLIYLYLMLVLFGMGCGILQPSATVLLMSQIDKSRHSIFSALSRMQVNTAIAIGAAIIAMTLSGKTLGLISEMHYVWLTALSLTIVVLVVPILGRQIRRMRQPRSIV